MAIHSAAKNSGGSSSISAGNCADDSGSCMVFNLVIVVVVAVNVHTKMMRSMMLSGGCL